MEVYINNNMVINKQIPSEPFKYVVHLVLIVMMLLNVFALDNIDSVISAEMNMQSQSLGSIDQRLESMETKLIEMEINQEVGLQDSGESLYCDPDNFTLYADEYVAFINTVGPVLRQNPEMIQVLAIYWIAQNPIVVKYFDELEAFLPFEGE